MITSVLLATLCAGPVEIRVNAEELDFGEPFEFELELKNLEPNAVKSLRMLELSLLSADSRNTLSWNAHEKTVFQIDTGSSLALRMNAWSCLGSINWTHAQGHLVAHGLLLPGRYRLRARATTDAEPKRILVSETAILVRAGSRARELELVKTLVASVPNGFAPEYSAWSSTVASLRQCCATSPVLEPVWRAACKATGGLEAVSCVAGYVAAFPSSSSVGKLKDHAAQGARDHEEHKYLETLRRMPRAEWERYVEIESKLPDGPAALKTRLDLTRAFVRDYPNSLAAPAVLAEAVHALRAADRWPEADEFSATLVKQYKNSHPVRAWNAVEPLVRNPTPRSP